MILDTFSSLSFCKRHRAISLLFANDPNLFDFLFDPDHRHLGSASVVLAREAGFLPREERILALFALCIWTERGSWPVHEAYLFLCDYRYESVQMAMNFLGSIKPGPCICHVCLGSSENGETEEITQ